jgi:hypothetical protein
MMIPLMIVFGERIATNIRRIVKEGNNILNILHKLSQLMECFYSIKLKNLSWHEWTELNLVT